MTDPTPATRRAEEAAPTCSKRGPGEVPCRLIEGHTGWCVYVDGLELMRWGGGV